ncbi:type II secretion system minor pseudopilin GspJ [Oceanicaulis sp. MMSF_3324]|uniref:type II secretion system minor pseudopilin GspJ n=1 Tax=Oceanicaulis sp. MMSF_3324 TaxID=3046702 RepID=UPI00273FF460|nr:type II secretion system minor pseudopilin GspJ [Oceanicaulis sp. MMSF_3324]
MMRRQEAGFSLVEVMAAVMVFALISSISVGLLTTALRSKETSEAVMAELAAIQRVQALLTEDVGQMVLRPVRDEDGLTDQRVFALDARGADPLNPAREDEPREILVLTRTGWANPGGLQPRSGLQRVAWIYDGVRLWREASLYPDLAQGAAPVRQLIADNVTDLQIEALMTGVWSGAVEVRPGRNGEAAGQPPRAVRLSYVQASLGEMEHVALSPTAEVGR